MGFIILKILSIQLPECAVKNQARLFFFTNSEAVAKSLEEVASSKCSRNNYHLTQKHIQSPLSIIML
jgi:hypothetical protein